MRETHYNRVPPFLVKQSLRDHSIFPPTIFSSHRIGLPKWKKAYVAKPGEEGSDEGKPMRENLDLGLGLVLGES